jgi:hypothetical protein
MTPLRIRWTIPLKSVKFRVFLYTEFHPSWDKKYFCDIFAKIFGQKITFVRYFCAIHKNALADQLTSVICND